LPPDGFEDKNKKWGENGKRKDRFLSPGKGKFFQRPKKQLQKIFITNTLHSVFRDNDFDEQISSFSKILNEISETENENNIE